MRNEWVLFLDGFVRSDKSEDLRVNHRIQIYDKTNAVNFNERKKKVLSIPGKSAKNERF